MHGVLLLDKPSGRTSASAVNLIKQFVKPQKIGHGGTLDPLGTGVLPIVIGHATRLSAIFLEGEKEYTGSIRLGELRDTDDIDGRVVAVDDQISRLLETVDDQALSEIALSLTGTLDQMPPQFSAIKVGGRASYDRARAGEQVELRLRPVTISSLALWREAGTLIGYRVRCSKGTYVRSLARDIGAVLGSFGCIETLRRVAVGSFTIDECVPLDGILPAEWCAQSEELPQEPERVTERSPLRRPRRERLPLDADTRSAVLGRIKERLIPIERLVRQLPRVTVGRDEALSLLRGDQSPLRRLGASPLPGASAGRRGGTEGGDEAALIGLEGEFIGLLERDDQNGWRIRFLIPEAITRSSEGASNRYR